MKSAEAGVHEVPSVLMVGSDKHPDTKYSHLTIVSSDFFLKRLTKFVPVHDYCFEKRKAARRNPTLFPDSYQ